MTSTGPRSIRLSHSAALFACLIGILALAAGHPAFAGNPGHITVYYGTNRNLLDPKLDKIQPPNYVYGHWFGDGLSWGSAEVEIPANHPDWSADYSSKRKYLAAVRQEDKLWGKTKDLVLHTGKQNEVLSRLQGHSKFLVYVHGFNNDYEKAIKTAARLAYDYNSMSGGQDPITPIVFSWPCRQGLSSYMADEERVGLSRREFHRFMDAVMEKAQAGSGSANPPTIYMVSHSMGNRISLNYLAGLGEKIGENPKLGEKVLIKKVMMCSPDVSTLQYVAESPYASKVCSPIEVLFSDHDRALAVSQDLHDSPRLGRPAASTAWLRFLAQLPPPLARMLSFKVDLLPDWLPDLCKDKIPTVVKDQKIIKGTTSLAGKGASKMAAVPSKAFNFFKRVPPPMQDPNTVFIDFTQLDIGAFRLAFLPITFQIGHSLPGPVLATLLLNNQTNVPPPQWKAETKSRVFQLATSEKGSLTKRTIQTHKFEYARTNQSTPALTSK